MSSDDASSVTVEALIGRLEEEGAGDAPDVQRSIARVNYEPAVYLKETGIAAPTDRFLLSVKRFDPPKPPATTQPERLAGHLDWNDGHYVCEIYERADGAQYEVCWCQ